MPSAFFVVNNERQKKYRAVRRDEEWFASDLCNTQAEKGGGEKEREKKGEKETKQKSLLAVDRPFCCSLSFHLEKCFFNGDLWKRDREEKTTPAEQKQSETSAY